MLLSQPVSGDNKNESLLDHTKANHSNIYNYYKKLTPQGKIIFWSSIVLITTGFAVGVWALLRLPGNNTNNKNYRLTLGGEDIYGTLTNKSANSEIYGLVNETLWFPYNTLHVSQTNTSMAFQWASIYSEEITEGQTTLFCDEKGCSLTGKGYLLQNDYSYKIIFNYNTTCTQYKLFMESNNVNESMVCRSQGHTHPRGTKLTPYTVHEGEYYNLTFDRKSTFGTAHIDCYSEYGYTENRLEVSCNSTDYCEATPREGGFICEDNLWAASTTTPCEKRIFVNSCPINATDDTISNSTDDTISNVSSTWQKSWQKVSIKNSLDMLFHPLSPTQKESKSFDASSTYLRSNRF